jgi:hypothetical protein
MTLDIRYKFRNRSGLTVDIPQSEWRSLSTSVPQVGTRLPATEIQGVIVYPVIESVSEIYSYLSKTLQYLVIFKSGNPLQV